MRFKERNNLKTYICIVFTHLHLTKLYPFQNLSLGFILKVFLRFRKFQPRYSYKIYSYGEKVCIYLAYWKWGANWHQYQFPLNLKERYVNDIIKPDVHRKPRFIEKYGTDKLPSNDINSLKLLVINLCKSYHFLPNQKSDIYKIKPSLALHFIADEYCSDKRYWRWKPENIHRTVLLGGVY